MVCQQRKDKQCHDEEACPDDGFTTSLEPGYNGVDPKTPETAIDSEAVGGEEADDDYSWITDAWQCVESWWDGSDELGATYSDELVAADQPEHLKD